MNTDLTALIVDDQPLITRLCTNVIRKRGIQTTSAFSAEEAQTYVLTQPKPFDLIFLDIHMPGKSGIEFCQWLRNQPNGKSPYVIGMTADQEFSTYEKLTNAGANRYILKPLEPHAIEIHLDQALRDIALRPSITPTATVSPSAPTPLHGVITTHSPLPAALFIPECWSLPVDPNLTIPPNTLIQITVPFDCAHTRIQTSNNQRLPEPILLSLPSGDTLLGPEFVASNNAISEAIQVPISFFLKR